MKEYNYLKNYQEIPFQIFKNCLENNKFFHAYLLSGPTGTPLLNIAKYLALSLLNGEKAYYQDDNEILEKKIMNETYSDLIVLDGKEKTIKIDDIRQIEEQFSHTAFEKKGIKIYIINLVENMSIDSINALLKFLEEPLQDTYAFLTTENEFKVLATIKSRSEIVRFTSLNQNILIDKSLKLGVNDLDAELLSFFFNDEDAILKESKDKDYIKSKENVINLLNYLNDKRKLRFYLEKEILKQTNSKISIRFFLDLILVFLKESLKYKNKQSIILKSSEDLLNSIVSNIDNLDNSILELMNYRNELNYNINSNLLLLNMCDKIFKA